MLTCLMVVIVCVNCTLTTSNYKLTPYCEQTYIDITYLQDKFTNVYDDKKAAKNIVFKCNVVYVGRTIAVQQTCL